MLELSENYTEFLETIKTKVLACRRNAALSVNKALILLYHQISVHILQAQAEQGWGAKIIDQLSKDLSSNFPEMKGFSTRNLKYMRKFAAYYPDVEFVQEVLAQLSWYHNITILEKISTQEEASFYIRETIKNGWSRNQMADQIEKKLHQRQGQAVHNFDRNLSAVQSALAKSLLKDPYIFDFLSIGDEAQEREMEKALLTHVEKFL